ncbi:Nn.00g035880.m01.CDS01 [Neocucurbitaria sp. VM-36]
MNTSIESRWNPFRRHVLGSNMEYTGEITLPRTEIKSKTPETTVTRMPSWPEEAKPLKQHDWVSRSFIIGDILLVILPVYFLLLAIAVVRLDGQPVEGNAFASKVTSAIQLGPTLFPIMFAAISGRSMKMIARYLAEKGAKLSTLELLMASQSVWGTIESQLLMRRLTLVGANLLFLWAMSPLGGQASLRLLDRSTSTDQVFSPLRYLSTGPGSAVWAMTSGTYVENDGGLTQVEALYAAALLGSTQVKEGPEDTWGNVKIPYLGHLNGTQNSSADWTTIASAAQRPEDYASLVGIPVIGRPQDRDGSFSLETTQLTVECEPFVKVPVNNKTDYAELQRVVPGQIWQDMSALNSPWGDPKVVGGKTSTFFLETDIPLTNGGDDGDGRFNSFTGFVNASRAGQSFPKRKLTFASSYGFEPRGQTTLNIANCSLGQIHTETMVNCTSDQCAAVRIRPSKLDVRDQQVTPFDHVLISGMALVAFPKAFGWSRGSTTTEQFLFNTTSFQLVSPTTNLGDNPGWVDLSSLTPEVFAKRLALLLNTYYQLTIAPNAYLGNLPQNNFSAFGLDAIPAKDVDVYLPQNMTAQNTSFQNWYSDFQEKTYNAGIFFIGATTNATVSKTHEIFVCNFAWLSLLIAAASTVFLTGAASLMLKRKTLAPEMFGFVASMTYENRFVDIPEGGSTCDAMERARLLKDVEVHIGDVRGSEEVGHIAFATGVPLRKLERGRLYY